MEAAANSYTDDQYLKFINYFTNASIPTMF